MSIKLLLVDDNHDVRDMVKLSLRDTMIEVIGEAENGEEAILKTRELSPDVILMDILMPVMTGIEATRVIRAEFPNVVVLGFTASGTSQMSEMVDAGAAAVFEKMGFGRLINHIQALGLG